MLPARSRLESSRRCVCRVVPPVQRFLAATTSWAPEPGQRLYNQVPEPEIVCFYRFSCCGNPNKSFTSGGFGGFFHVKWKGLGWSLPKLHGEVQSKHIFEGFSLSFRPALLSGFLNEAEYARLICRLSEHDL